MSALQRAMVGCVLAFLLLPILSVVGSSLGSGAMMAFPPSGFTLTWYANIPAPFLDGLRVSLLVGCTTAAIASCLGLGLALALARGRFAGRRALELFCLSPLMTPSLVVAVALFEYSGFLWSATGVSLQDSLTGIVLGHTACATPYAVRAILAAHSRFDYSLEEAAQSLGAGAIRTLASVTIPVLTPGIAAGAVFGLLISLDDLPIALFMGGDDATATLPVRIYSAIEYNLKPDIMAVSTLLVGASLILMVVLDRIVGVDKVFGGREV